MRNSKTIKISPSFSLLWFILPELAYIGIAWKKMVMCHLDLTEWNCHFLWQIRKILTVIDSVCTCSCRWSNWWWKVCIWNVGTISCYSSATSSNPFLNKMGFVIQLCEKTILKNQDVSKLTLWYNKHQSQRHSFQMRNLHCRSNQLKSSKCL